MSSNTEGILCPQPSSLKTIIPLPEIVSRGTGTVLETLVSSSSPAPIPSYTALPGTRATGSLMIRPSAAGRMSALKLLSLPESAVQHSPTSLSLVAASGTVMCRTRPRTRSATFGINVPKK